jgi:hypothetical protein
MGRLSQHNFFRVVFYADASVSAYLRDHFVLDSDGRPVDVLPCPYGPESCLAALVARLEADVTADSLFNELGLHHRIHGWFANGEAPISLEGLTTKVYTELFLTPATDPWLGMAPATFTGLPGDGLDRNGALPRDPSPQVPMTGERGTSAERTAAFVLAIRRVAQTAMSRRALKREIKVM